MKNYKKLNNKGFSLMELLVTLAISSFVILAALSLVMVGTKNYDGNSKQTTLQKEVSFTTNILGENIRASKVDDKDGDDDNNPKIIYNVVVGGTTTNDIQIETDSKIIRYFDNKNALCIYEKTDSIVYNEQNVISKYIENFDVDYIANKSVTLETGSLGEYVEAKKCEATAMEFNISFNYKDKTDTASVIFKIRNDS